MQLAMFISVKFDPAKHSVDGSVNSIVISESWSFLLPRRKSRTSSSPQTDFSGHLFDIQADTGTNSAKTNIVEHDSYRVANRGRYKVGIA